MMNFSFQHLFTLAQAAPAAAPAVATPPAAAPLTPESANLMHQTFNYVPTFWSSVADNAFAFTILFIFLTAIITVLIQQRKKDKCLKLFRKYHVSYITAAGQAIWGDLIVYSQGLELVFDAPHINERKLSKESAMIYDNELPLCLAICRALEGQTGEEKKLRQKQIHRSFNPGMIRRSIRWTRNLFNTLRDAFGKAFTAALGQIAKVRTQDTVLTQQKGSMDQIGQTLLTAVGNAYEPMLERHIGKPVVLELACPNSADKKPIQLPGYLVDYSERFVAVFNVDHEPESVDTLTVTENIEHENYKVVIDNAHVFISCTGSDLLVVRWIEVDGVRCDLAAVLINGTTLRMGIGKQARPIRVELAITRKLDIVCPRTMGKVKFGSGGMAIDRQDWSGRAPDEEEIQNITPHVTTSVTTVTTATTTAATTAPTATPPSTS